MKLKLIARFSMLLMAAAISACSTMRNPNGDDETRKIEFLLTALSNINFKKNINVDEHADLRAAQQISEALLRARRGNVFALTKFDEHGARILYWEPYKLKLSSIKPGDQISADFLVHFERDNGALGRRRGDRIRIDKACFILLNDKIEYIGTILIDPPQRP
jgi:hypothetical protein